MVTGLAASGPPAHVPLWLPPAPNSLEITRLPSQKPTGPSHPSKSTNFRATLILTFPQWAPEPSPMALSFVLAFAPQSHLWVRPLRKRLLWPSRFRLRVRIRPNTLLVRWILGLSQIAGRYRRREWQGWGIGKRHSYRYRSDGASRRVVGLRT